MKVTEVVVSQNEVEVKSNVRVMTITKHKKGSNLIHIKGLTSLVGVESGVRSFISEDGLVKNSQMCMSDEAILDLYVALSHYAEEVLGLTSKTEKKNK